MKKQLKIWREDLARYWDKTSLMGRVLLGAVISFLIAMIILRTVSNPITKEIKELRSKASTEYVPVPEEDQEIKDGKLEIEDKKKSLAIWKRKLQKLLRERKNFGPEMQMKVISELDSLAAENNLQLLVRNDVEKDVREKKKRNRPDKKAAEPKPQERELTGEFQHQYVLLGRFKNIRNFLLKAAQLPYFFRIAGIAITHYHPEKGQSIGANTRGWALKVSFTVTIYYLKDQT